MIGHNKGPSMEGGQAWRTHCWRKARKSLLKTLPIEILRVRVARAAEIGLDYKSYASIRAASGHDVIAFLFSSNALRVLPKSKVMPQDRVLKLDAMQNVSRLAALHAPLKTLPSGAPEMPSFTAPNFSHTWGETRGIILSQIHARNLPRDGVVVIGDTAHERAWSEAARLAGYVSAEQFFAAR
ncbi:MAG: hypothetical protein GQ535_09120 [Rhodobacteraceae bacterium]|nr:hypothetical protein [Paracoccaceae bacterium]